MPLNGENVFVTSPSAVSGWSANFRKTYPINERIIPFDKMKIVKLILKHVYCYGVVFSYRHGENGEKMKADVGATFHKNDMVLGSIWDRFCQRDLTDSGVTNVNA
jgi:hypothetical protein